jgi:excisionase family DNA binding protein
MPIEDTEETATGEVVDPLADTPGDWLTIEAAADRLACSQRTVWRMVSRGQLRRRGVGGRAEVFVPTGMPPVGTPSSDMVPATRATPDTVTLAVIDELRRQREADTARLTELTDKLAASERDNGQLTAEAAELRRQLDEARRPWWRRMFGR